MAVIVFLVGVDNAEISPIMALSAAERLKAIELSFREIFPMNERLTIAKKKFKFGKSSSPPHNLIKPDPKPQT